MRMYERGNYTRGIRSAWQRWPWKLSLPLTFGRAGGSSASSSASASASSRTSFRSPTRAQFWFEWRAHIGGSWLFVSGLSGAALLIMAVVAARVGTLSEGDTEGLMLTLLGVPLFIHFLHGLAPPEFLLTTEEIIDA